MLMPFHSVVPCVVPMMRNLSLTAVRKESIIFMKVIFWSNGRSTCSFKYLIHIKIRSMSPNLIIFLAVSTIYSCHVIFLCTQLLKDHLIYILSGLFLIGTQRQAGLEKWMKNRHYNVLGHKLLPPTYLHVTSKLSQECAFNLLLTLWWLAFRRTSKTYSC